MAAMVPISGSAYTYSYATLGELVAWIIGWDLILEYAIGNVAVAISWANYFRSLMESIGINIPLWLSTDFRTAHKIPGLIESAPHILGVPIVFNVLAFGIVTLDHDRFGVGYQGVGTIQRRDGDDQDPGSTLLHRHRVVFRISSANDGQLASISAKRVGRHTGRSRGRLLRLYRF